METTASLPTGCACAFLFPSFAKRNVRCFPFQLGSKLLIDLHRPDPLDPLQEACGPPLVNLGGIERHHGDPAPQEPHAGNGGIHGPDAGRDGLAVAAFLERQQERRERRGGRRRRVRLGPAVFFDRDEPHVLVRPRRFDHVVRLGQGRRGRRPGGRIGLDDRHDEGPVLALLHASHLDAVPARTHGSAVHRHHHLAFEIDRIDGGQGRGVAIGAVVGPEGNEIGRRANDGRQGFVNAAGVALGDGFEGQARGGGGQACD
mmetsp:Transcript_34719/g.70907  ORF Transcript_34719/g.70907 Transcript_34719/m.70907 type:complete len:259 (-) Transcript_34719:153-929(-)